MSSGVHDRRAIVASRVACGRIHGYAALSTSKSQVADNCQLPVAGDRGALGLKAGLRVVRPQPLVRLDVEAEERVGGIENHVTADANHTGRATSFSVWCVFCCEAFNSALAMSFTDRIFSIVVKGCVSWVPLVVKLRPPWLMIEFAAGTGLPATVPRLPALTSTSWVSVRCMKLLSFRMVGK